ncbi:hypothetical protein BC828DRAFT_23083 [Blastocladiella britannica]|nr:hypothetical protein BC828DRAFT_23083 [Blastocladiella britannica]
MPATPGAARDPRSSSGNGGSDRDQQQFRTPATSTATTRGGAGPGHHGSPHSRDWQQHQQQRAQPPQQPPPAAAKIDNLMAQLEQFEIQLEELEAVSRTNSVTRDPRVTSAAATTIAGGERDIGLNQHHHHIDPNGVILVDDNDDGDFPPPPPPPPLPGGDRARVEVASAVNVSKYMPPRRGSDARKQDLDRMQYRGSPVAPPMSTPTISTRPAYTGQRTYTDAVAHGDGGTHEDGHEEDGEENPPGSPRTMLQSMRKVSALRSKFEQAPASATGSQTNLRRPSLATSTPIPVAAAAKVVPTDTESTAAITTTISPRYFEHDALPTHIRGATAESDGLGTVVAAYTGDKDATPPPTKSQLEQVASAIGAISPRTDSRPSSSGSVGSNKRVSFSGASGSSSGQQLKSTPPSIPVQLDTAEAAAGVPSGMTRRPSAKDAVRAAHAAGMPAYPLPPSLASMTTTGGGAKPDTTMMTPMTEAAANVSNAAASMFDDTPTSQRSPVTALANRSRSSSASTQPMTPESRGVLEHESGAGGNSVPVSVSNSTNVSRRASSASSNASSDLRRRASMQMSPTSPTSFSSTSAATAAYGGQKQGQPITISTGGTSSTTGQTSAAQPLRDHQGRPSMADFSDASGSPTRKPSLSDLFRRLDLPLDSEPHAAAPNAPGNGSSKLDPSSQRPSRHGSGASQVEAPPVRPPRTIAAVSPRPALSPSPSDLPPPRPHIDHDHHGSAWAEDPFAGRPRVDTAIAPGNPAAAAGAAIQAPLPSSLPPAVLPPPLPPTQPQRQVQPSHSQQAPPPTNARPPSSTTAYVSAPVTISSSVRPSSTVSTMTNAAQRGTIVGAPDMDWDDAGTDLAYLADLMYGGGSGSDSDSSGPGKHDFVPPSPGPLPPPQLSLAFPTSESFGMGLGSVGGSTRPALPDPPSHISPQSTRSSAGSVPTGAKGLLTAVNTAGPDRRGSLPLSPRASNAATYAPSSNSSTESAAAAPPGRRDRSSTLSGGLSPIKSSAPPLLAPSSYANPGMPRDLSRSSMPSSASAAAAAAAAADDAQKYSRVTATEMAERLQAAEQRRAAARAAAAMAEGPFPLGSSSSAAATTGSGRVGSSGAIAGYSSGSSIAIAIMAGGANGSQQQLQQDDRVTQALARLAAASVQKIPVRVYITDMSTFKTIEVASGVSAGVLAEQVVERAQLVPSTHLPVGPGMTAAATAAVALADGAWTLFEVFNDVGVERPLRDWERVTDVLRSWERGETKNALVLRRYSHKSSLTVNALKMFEGPVKGELWLEVKPGSFKKRRFELSLGAEQNGGSGSSASSNGGGPLVSDRDVAGLYMVTSEEKPAVLLCSLAHYDVRLLFCTCHPIGNSHRVKNRSIPWWPRARARKRRLSLGLRSSRSNACRCLRTRTTGLCFTFTRCRPRR